MCYPEPPLFHTEADTHETEINKVETPPEPVKKKGIPVLVWILIAIFIVIILGSGTVALLQYNGNINIAFLNGIIPTKAKTEVAETNVKQKKVQGTNKKLTGKAKPQQIKKDSTAVANTNNTSTQPVKNNTTVQPVKNNTTVQPVKNNPTKQVNTTSNPGGKFFIIAGSYKTMQLAEDAIKILKSKGHEGAKVVDNNQEGHIRICYGAYATRQDATQDLTTIQKNENPTAWIYKKK